MSYIINKSNLQKYETIIKSCLRKKEIELRLINTGWRNLVFDVDSKFIFRFPRNLSSVEALNKEADLLPKLENWLPVKIPHFLAISPQQ